MWPDFSCVSQQVSSHASDLSNNSSETMNICCAILQSIRQSINKQYWSNSILCLHTKTGNISVTVLKFSIVIDRKSCQYCIPTKVNTKLHKIIKAPFPELFYYNFLKLTALQWWHIWDLNKNSKNQSRKKSKNCYLALQHFYFIYTLYQQQSCLLPDHWQHTKRGPSANLLMLH